MARGKGRYTRAVIYTTGLLEVAALPYNSLAIRHPLVLYYESLPASPYPPPLNFIYWKKSPFS